MRKISFVVVAVLSIVLASCGLGTTGGSSNASANASAGANAGGAASSVLGGVLSAVTNGQTVGNVLQSVLGLDKLTQKGESPEAAASAVDWLCEKGLLDDGRYAGMVVRHYAAKGYGQSRVRQELQRRGVSRELWEEALRELPEPEDKLDAYLASKLKDPGDRAQVQKVSAALIRRGFSWEEIRAALARYRDGMEE